MKHLLGVLAFLSGAVACGRVPTECDCATAVLNEWCDKCEVGYVAAFPIESRTLFDALDAHGHKLDREKMSCATCKEMMGTGGFCEACRFGWVDGQAYMSRLTYHLALGESRDLSSVTCPTCEELSGGEGWCDACEAGWAGNVYFRNRDDHEDAVRELARLHTATEASERCEFCALMILVDGQCPECRISYHGGKPAEED